MTDFLPLKNKIFLKKIYIDKEIIYLKFIEKTKY